MDNLSDKELFEEALTEEVAPAPEPAPQEAAQPEATGQPRDENGRYARVDGEAQPQPEEQPAPQAQTEGEAEPALVPSKRLKEEADRRRALEEQNRILLEQLSRVQTSQPPQAPPQPQPQAEDEGKMLDELLTNPQGFLARRDAANMQNIGIMMVDMQEGGREARAEAWNAITELARTNPVEARAAVARIEAVNPLMQARALLDWHKDHQTRQRVGSDPDAFAQNWLESKLKDPSFAASLVEKLRGGAPAAQQNGGAPAVSLPPSLSRVTSVAPASGGPVDLSDAGIFADAFNR